VLVLIQLIVNSTGTNNAATYLEMDTLANNTHPQWWNDSGMRRLNCLLLSCYIGAITNGYISSLISNLIANPRYFQDIQGLSHPKLLGLVTAAQSMGCIAAFFPAPWLSDKYGRRVGIIFGNIGMIAGFTGQIFCTRFDQFLGMRILVGFSSISNTISSSALLVELAHPRQRAVAGALFNTCYFIGSITAAWVSYGALRIRGSWSWKLPVAIQLFWSLAQLSLIMFCPESPRWLVRHGQQEKAKTIMTQFHANGLAGDELVSTEFARMCASTAAEAQNNTTGWLALLATPGNRKRLVLSVVIAVATQWVGNGIVRYVSSRMVLGKYSRTISFYLAPVLRTVGITNSLHQQGINGGLQIYVWPLACAAALLCEKAGRRRLFLTSTSLMLVFMVLITICSALYSATGSASAGYAVIVFIFLFFGGYVIGLTPIPILYVNEIWPSHLRTKGTSVFWVSQAVSITFNQFVNPVAIDKIAWKYYLVYIGVLVVLINFIFFYVPETKGLSLEQISGIFDPVQDVTVELPDVRRDDEA
jgi:MFS family permease